MTMIRVQHMWNTNPDGSPIEREMSHRMFSLIPSTQSPDGETVKRGGWLVLGDADTETPPPAKLVDQAKPKRKRGRPRKTPVTDDA